MKRHTSIKQLDRRVYSDQGENSVSNGSQKTSWQTDAIRAEDLEPDPAFDPMKEAEECRNRRAAPLFFQD